jgi:hypothetical protein
VTPDPVDVTAKELAAKALAEPGFGRYGVAPTRTAEELVAAKACHDTDCSCGVKCQESRRDLPGRWWVVNTVNTDLHAILLAAVEHRLETARGAMLATEDTLHLTWPRQVGKTALAAFWAANSPDRVIRMAEADLRRLERHRPVEAQSRRGMQTVCELEWGAGEGWIAPWPCEDVRDVAASYGVALSTPPSTPEETP